MLVLLASNGSVGRSDPRSGEIRPRHLRIFGGRPSVEGKTPLEKSGMVRVVLTLCTDSSLLWG